MSSQVKCRLCGSLPYTSIHKVPIGHGEFVEECVLYCRFCHVHVSACDRESVHYKDLALQRWERFMK